MMNIKSKKTKSFKYFAMALLAVSSMSCSQDEDVINEFPAGDGGYFSVAINAPTTKTAGAAEAGSEGESTVGSAYYFGYNKSNMLVQSGSLVLTEGSNQSAKVKAKSSMTQIFVIANPSELIGEYTHATFAQLKALVKSTNATNYANDSFLMAGEGLVPVKFHAETTPTTGVSVSRVVSRVVLAPFTATAVNVPNGTAAITGSLLNITNKKMYVSSDTVKYQVGTLPDMNNDYRKDPNYDAVLTSTTTGYASEFNVLKNTTALTAFLPHSVAQYCGENTSAAGVMNTHNLTSILASATYFPTGFAAESWFILNGKMMSFEAMNTLMTKAEPTVAEIADKALITSFIESAFERASVTPVPVNAALFATAAHFDTQMGIINGHTFGCLTTPANDLMSYYKKGVCFYSIVLTHNDQMATQPNELGRFGVVRNNAYAVAINNITAPGLPYIPDPTDPDIIDPIDPEKPDKSSMDVTITVKDWATWSQGVDL